MYPEPTMIQNGHSSPIVAFASDDDTGSRTESDSTYWMPENQLGLQPGERFWDDQEVDLDVGEIRHHEAIAKY